jgi:hypothetical protein
MLGNFPTWISWRVQSNGVTWHDNFSTPGASDGHLGPTFGAVVKATTFEGAKNFPSENLYPREEFCLVATNFGRVIGAEHFEKSPLCYKRQVSVRVHIFSSYRLAHNAL